MKLLLKFLLLVTYLLSPSTAQFNPTILQDTRNEPKLDGTFGFLYRTEDGISHAAKADPGGIVHGRFTYTDPTGLKVNFNYNAGSAVTPKYNYNAIPVATPSPVYNQGQVQEDRRTKPPALQQQLQQQPQYYQPVAQQPLIQPVYQQPTYQQPIQQPTYQQPIQQPVYQQPNYQQQGIQHPLANLQPDPFLPEDDGSYHPELDAQYEYHDSDNNLNVNYNNNYPVSVFRQ